MNILASSGLAVFITSLVTAVFVYINNPKKQLNITWGLFCFFVSMWGLGLYLGFTTSDKISALFWGRFLNLSAIFIPLFFLHFIYVFVGLSKNKKSFLTLAYIITILYFFLSLLMPHLFVKDVVPKAPFAFYPEAGLIYYIFPILYSILVLCGIFDLFRAYRVSRGQKRNQINYLFWGMAIGFAGGATTFPYVFNINIYPFATWAVIIYVLLVTYAITKTRLMDISVVIRRTTAWILTILFLGSIYIGWVLAYRIYISSQIDLLFLAGTILYGIFVGITFQGIRLRIQTTAEKLFLKGKYEFRKEAPDIAEKLASVVSLKDLSQAIEEIRLENIEAASIDVLLPEDFGGLGGRKDVFVVWDLGKTTAKTAGAKLDKNNLLIQRLLKDKRPLVKAEIPKEAAAILDKNSFEVCVPCFSRGGLIAILLIGKKLSEDPYRDEELDVFRTLAPQFAIVIERIKPYEQVTEQYQKTKEIAQQAVQQAQYGALIQRVRHEFNNPLAMMLTRSELVLKKLDDREAVKKFAEVVIRNIKRLMELTEAMQRVGRTNHKATEIGNVNVNGILKDILLVGGATFEGRGIRIIEQLGNIPAINANESEIYQAFLNLVLNAADAMQSKGGGDLTLTTQPVKMQKTTGEIVEGVEVRIKDTGSGISQENLDKLFDPFFSTKEKGSGLGLSRTAEIVADYGGTIEVETEVDKGTAFVVRLPRT